MNSLAHIINILGYGHSDMLFYQKDIISGNRIKQYINPQMYRIVKELNPDAVFCADNKPFIAFFEINSIKNKRILYSKIWNMQIPIVFIIYEDKIEIYNGYSLDAKTQELLYVASFDYDKLNEDCEFSYWKISHSCFWDKYDNEFRTPRIDNVMLENIKCIMELLNKSSCAPFSVILVLRLIFIRFLIDRGIDLDYPGFSCSIKASQTTFLQILQAKDELYKLIHHLKNKFNGNLFELYYDNNNICEKDLLTEQSLQQLYQFMSGELKMNNGQYSLFPLYDFNIIPIELISNIYERFLGDNKRKEDSAFYTPPYLVDYILSHTIRPFLAQNQSCKVLDPSCGSGIFLVQALRLIIEKNMSQNYINDNEKLISLVEDNIFGIDKNPEAIDVAIFSIYVTLLDYKDPKTLKNFKLPTLKESNFIEADFFDDKIKEKFTTVKFDFIIGNPPWGRMNTGLHIDYCKKKGYKNQNNEIARSFVYRTKDLSHGKTKCCLIVTSKIFYNMKSSAADFRKWLLVKTRILKFIELSAVREMIFKNARGPAAVVFYTFSDDKEANLQNDITHIVLMPNLFFKLFNIIVIEKNNYKYIAQKLLYKDDWAWKTVVFGSSKDYFLIKKMKSKYKSLQNYIKENNFISGTGIQTDGTTNDASHLQGRKLIDSRKGVESFKINLQYSQIFDKNSIHRIRDERLFIAPFVLIKKGFNTKNYKLRAAFSNESFLYKDAITGIAGDDEETLLSITGLINSSLYSYFNLMLGASAGIEREQSFPTEIMQYPALIDKGIAEKSKQIMDYMQDADLEYNNKDIEEKLLELDNYILGCFNLDDCNSIKYILDVQIPMLSGKLSYDYVTDNQLIDYAEVISNYFDMILLTSGQFISLTFYNNLINNYAAIEFKIANTKPESRYTFINNTNFEQLKTMDLFSKLMLHKINDKFYQVKDVIYFEESSFYILKSNEAKKWHKAIAELDLSEIIDYILTKEEGSRLKA